VEEKKGGRGGTSVGGKKGEGGLVGVVRGVSLLPSFFSQKGEDSFPGSRKGVKISHMEGGLNTKMRKKTGNEDL